VLRLDRWFSLTRDSVCAGAAPLTVQYMTARKPKQKSWDLEVWKPNRQVREVTAQVLQIQSPESFWLHWTNDGWASASDTPSTSTGIGIEFADIAIDGNRSAPVRFTFFWTGSNHWVGTQL
jgi:glucoamylase